MTLYWTLYKIDNSRSKATEITIFNKHRCLLKTRQNELRFQKTIRIFFFYNFRRPGDLYSPSSELKILIFNLESNVDDEIFRLQTIKLTVKLDVLLSVKMPTGKLVDIRLHPSVLLIEYTKKKFFLLV